MICLIPLHFRFELPEWICEAMKSEDTQQRVDAALDAYLSLHLPRGLIDIADERTRRLQDIYLKSVETVARTELYGFAFDRKKHERMVSYLVNEMTNDEKEIYRMAGERWDLGSPKETAHVSLEFGWLSEAASVSR